MIKIIVDKGEITVIEVVVCAAVNSFLGFCILFEVTIHSSVYFYKSYYHHKILLPLGMVVIFIFSNLVRLFFFRF